MTFRAITAKTGSKREPVLISVRRVKGYARVRVTLHPDFLQQIGWSATVRVQPYLGSAEDAGTIRIKSVPTGDFRLKPVKNSCRFFLEFVIQDVPETWPASQPEFSADTLSKSIDIRLPWAERKLRMVG